MPPLYTDRSHAEKAADLKNRKAGGVLIPNRADINAHLHALFPPEFVKNYPDCWFEIAFGYAATGGSINAAAMFTVFELKEAGDFADERNRVGFNIYVSGALRQGDRPQYGRAKKEAVATATHVWTEFDAAGAAAVVDAKMKELDLRARMVVTTGTVPHLRAWIYFGLSTAPSVDQLGAGNTVLKKLFGDKVVDDVQNADRVMRLAGTVNHPTPKKLGDGYIKELVTLRLNAGAPSYSVDHLLALGGNASNGADHGAGGGGGEETGPRSNDDIRKMLEECLDSTKWHPTMLRVVASLIGRGWTNFQIKMTCAPYCTEGFNSPELAKLIEDARVKWTKPDTDPRAEQGSTADALPERPRPLVREIEPAEPFPDEELGEVMGNAARAIQDLTQAPMAICAQSVLAAMTLAVQGFADIELHPGQRSPISCFFITVAESGERKTSADKYALAPVDQYRKALCLQHDIDKPRYENAKIAWDKARDAAVKSGEGDQCKITAALDALGPPPIEPLDPVLTCREPTVEGLFKLMLKSRACVGLFSAEGASFVGGHGMTADTKLRMAGSLSDFWDGVDQTRTRGGEGTTILQGRRLALHLMMQSEVAAVLLSDPLLLNQGITSRILVSAPPTTAGTRKRRKPKASSIADLQVYNEVMLKILNRKMTMVPGKLNEVSPPVLPLSPEAQALWDVYYDANEEQQRPEGTLASIRGLAGKMPEHAARLAAVREKADDIMATEISPRSMAAGIALAQYYTAEALRIFERGMMDVNLLLATKLLDWVREWLAKKVREEKIPLISLREIYQFGPNAIRDHDTAGKIAFILQTHGWFYPLENGAEIDGHHCKKVWRLIEDT